MGLLFCLGAWVETHPGSEREEEQYRRKLFSIVPEGRFMVGCLPSNKNLEN